MFALMPEYPRRRQSIEPVCKLPPSFGLILDYFQKNFTLVSDEPDVRKSNRDHMNNEMKNLVLMMRKIARKMKILEKEEKLDLARL